VAAHVLLKIPANDTVPLLAPLKGKKMSKSADLKNRKAAAVPAGVGSRGIYVAKAENSELWDVDGRRYIDFAAGIAVLNTGHRHPRVMEAVAMKNHWFIKRFLDNSFKYKNKDYSIF